MEQLKAIPDAIGYYADRDGNIWSEWVTGKNPRRDNSKMKKMNGRKCGKYIYINLRIKKCVYRSEGIHRLICKAFYGIPSNENLTASHIDGNPNNNKLSNLCWETQKENNYRKKKHGTDDSGYRNSRSKINKKQLIKIRKMLNDGKKTHKEIGDIFGVNRVFITKIKNGYRYANC